MFEALQIVEEIQRGPIDELYAKVRQLIDGSYSFHLRHNVVLNLDDDEFDREEKLRVSLGDFNSSTVLEDIVQPTLCFEKKQSDEGFVIYDKSWAEVKRDAEEQGIYALARYTISDEEVESSRDPFAELL